MTLIGTTSTSVIACGTPDSKKDTRIDLNTIITNKNIDKIYVGQLEKPNKKQILEAIQNKNTLAKTLTENDFDFENNPNDTTATITGKNNYEGKVSLEFTISMFKKIDTKNIIESFTIMSILKINNVIYVSTNNVKNFGVYKSTDGSTFTAMTGTSGAIWSLAIDKDGNIYAGTDNGTVYKSTDGSTFTAMSGTSGEIRSLTSDKNNNIYAVGRADSKPSIFISEKL